MDLGNLADVGFAKLIANSLALSLEILTCKSRGVTVVRSMYVISLVICTVRCRPYWNEIAWWYHGKNKTARRKKKRKKEKTRHWRRNGQHLKHLSFNFYLTMLCKWGRWHFYVDILLLLNFDFNIAKPWMVSNMRNSVIGRSRKRSVGREEFWMHCCILF